MVSCVSCCSWPKEYLLPYTNQAYNLIWRTRIQRVKTDPRLGLFKKGQIWYRSAQHIWSAQTSVPLEQRLLGVTIYTLDAQGVIRERYDATEARHDGQGWLLVQGIRRTFNAAGMFAGLPEMFTEHRVAFPERPEEISALRKEPEEMGLRETLAYAHALRQQGVADSFYLVAFHGKLAYAVLCIIMVGFGMPLALHMNRNGGLTLALSLTLFCGFTYVILHNFLLALGHNGRLPPVVAAWAATGLFGCGGSIWVCVCSKRHPTLSHLLAQSGHQRFIQGEMCRGTCLPGELCCPLAPGLAELLR